MGRQANLNSFSQLSISGSPTHIPSATSSGSGFIPTSWRFSSDPFAISPKAKKSVKKKVMKKLGSGYKFGANMGDMGPSSFCGEDAFTGTFTGFGTGPSTGSA